MCSYPIPISMKLQNLLLTLGFLFLLSTLSAQSSTLYVHAPSGLNMRTTSDPGSAKIATIPLGTKVKLLSAPASNGMLIDNLKGGMAKVSANGETGYMFSGYLLPYPVPTPGAKVEDYVQKLRNAQISYQFEEHRYDNDGHASYHEVFYLNKDDYQGAWVVAQRLFKIPKSMKFPDPNSKADSETIDNPQAAAGTWGDGITVRRKNGKLIEISYFQEREGGGWSVSIEPGRAVDYKEDKIRVAYVAVAD